MFYLDPEVKQLIDEEGRIPKAWESEVSGCIEAAERLCKRMLGCTLVIRGVRFILTNLEIYYGGIGDHAHDWYRLKFPQFYEKKARGINRNHTEAQLLAGPRIYLKQKTVTLENGKTSGRNRMDLVVGGDGVAISLLVRNLASEDGSLVGDINGNPALILGKKGLQLTGQENGTRLGETPGFELLDTHGEYVKDSGKIVRNKRFTDGGYCGFSTGPFGESEWNFRLPL